MNCDVSYTDIRQHLKSYLDKVCEEHVPLRVTRKNGDNVVVISEEDYRSLEETAYLSRSPKNIQRLIAALSRKSGKSLDEVRHELGI